MTGSWAMRALAWGACASLVGVPGCYVGIDDAPLGVFDPEQDDGVDPDAEPDDPMAACAEEPPLVGAGGLRLLTRYEYDNTVRDLLGDPQRPASLAFPPENQTTAFENNAADHRASKDLVRVYMDVAEDVAARAAAERLASLLPCDPLAMGETACGHAFVDELLPRAFRRPVRSTERADFVALFDEVHAAFGFTEAVALVLQGVLQSPQFLYRLELPPEDAQPGEIVPVPAFEMASRLSYFLTASMPDAELWDAAQADALGTVQEVEAQAWRLLQTDAGRESVRQFHRQWLDLGGLASVTKDAAMSPEIAPALPENAGELWRQSVERFAEHVFFDGGGTIDDLLDSDLAFLDPTMALIYGAGPVDPDTGAVILLGGERAGLLTQPGLMALLAYPDQSSPVARGVFVRERMLCQHLPPPPNDVVIEPPNPDPNATTRERFAEHTSNPDCSGCHSLIDPLGFGFEHYDAIGRWRAEENGLAVDASGSLAGIEDAAVVGDFDGAVELADKLMSSTDFRACVAHQWTTFALGREPGEADACTVAWIADALQQQDGDLQGLLVAIATSDAFRYRVADGGAP